MEIILGVVTVVSLALALGMSFIAWRFLRDDRRRSAARSEALAAMASEPEDAEDGTWHLALGTEKSFTPDTDISLAANTARYSAFDDDDELGPLHQQDARGLDTWDAGLERDVVPLPSLPRARSGRWLAVAAIAVPVAAVAGVFSLYGPIIVAHAMTPGNRTPERTAAARPLELLSLRNSAEPDGTFTVTGLVQNPADGETAGHVIAVVYLFDRDGNYVADGKAPVDVAALRPGTESPFRVRVANVGPVSRYRVGFRSDEGAVVAHVDRRGR